MDITQLTYYKNLANFKKLTREDEKALVREYQTAVANNNSEKAEEIKNKFIENNLRLVIFAASKFYRKNPQDHIDDIIQDGSIGLIRAVEKFDPNKDFKFSTYAMWWIKQAMSRGLEHRQEIRLPSHVVIWRRKFSKVINEYLKTHKRQPTLQEMKNSLGEDISDEMLSIVDRIIRENPNNNLETSFSINKGNSTDSAEFSAEHYIADESEEIPEVIDSHIKRNIIKKAIEQLPKRKQDILKSRFGIDCESQSLEAIGSQMKISRERVRQLEKESLEFLRGMSVIKELAA